MTVPPFSKDTRLEQFGRRRNPWVWPNEHFPFRLYYDGKECRIFVIENVLHNFGWLREVHGSIRPTDWFIVYVGWHLSEEACRQSMELCEMLGIADRVWMMYNDVDEMEHGRAAGFDGDLVNQNCWLDWDIYRSTGTPKSYSAICIARALGWKRHHLAAGVDNLALVVGDPHGSADLVDVGWLRPAYLNERPLGQREVVEMISRSRVALFLSAEEGACHSSGECLLCGVPVVSTRSVGGRAIWYDDRNSIVCDADAGAVAEAVRTMSSRNPDPEAIREAHVEKSGMFRERFIRKTAGIVASCGGSDDMRAHFGRSYFDKMRRSMHVKEVMAMFGKG